MMGQKITIELPDWAQERHIYIMAGIEMLAYKLYGEDIIHIKENRCSFCGDCCMDLTLSSRLPIGPDGDCVYLQESVGGARECDLGINRPFGCSTGMQRVGAFGHKNCTVTYREEKI